MAKHLVSTEIQVGISWEEELVDNERSNFYVRLKPRASLKKIRSIDAAGHTIGETIVDESKKDLKGKFKHVKVS